MSSPIHVIVLLFPGLLPPHVKLPSRLHLFVCVIHDQEKTFQQYKWFSVKQELVAIQLPWAEIHTTICERLGLARILWIQQKGHYLDRQQNLKSKLPFWLGVTPQSSLPAGMSFAVPLTLDSSCPGPSSQERIKLDLSPRATF